MANKPKRHGPTLDMTAMCDVAFLLLTFFIMASSFKSEEAVVINTPSSVSDDIVPDTDVAMVTIDPEGKFYFGVRDPSERDDFAKTLSDKFNLNLTNKEILEFQTLAEVGIPMKQLKGYLGLNKVQRESLVQPGIPLDSANTELVDWVKAYTELNPSSQLAVRGDNTTSYPSVKVLFDEFGKADLNKFQLVTKTENAPKE